MNTYFLILVILLLSFLVLRKTRENFQVKSSYSQIRQDLKVLEYYNNKKNGYFVEIGANDGINLSNTYLLESKYNWKGICVEPVPSIYQKLKKNRLSINISNACYNTNNEYVDIVEANLLSGIKKDIDKHHKKTENKKIVKVMTKTLTNILNENNAPKYIEYLSIDTEGSELKILQGIDFDKYRFGYINIEHNNVEPKRSQMKDLLIKNGYKYMGENKWDDIYVLI